MTYTMQKMYATQPIYIVAIELKFHFNVYFNLFMASRSMWSLQYKWSYLFGFFSSSLSHFFTPQSNVRANSMPLILVSWAIRRLCDSSSGSRCSCAVQLQCGTIPCFKYVQFYLYHKTVYLIYAKYGLRTAMTNVREHGLAKKASKIVVKST